MNAKFIGANLVLIILCFNAVAQSNIEVVISEIAKNNKSIQAVSQFYAAQSIQFKTGLTPSNPQVEYDLLFGNTSEIGNQSEFSITQQFDFPTAYFRQSELAKTKSIQIEYQLTASRQDILLEAKMYCIELIYQHKLRKQFELQKLYIEKILENFKVKLDNGDGNLLDVNKAKLQLIEINKQLVSAISEINQLGIKLTELNGGNALIFTDTVYPNQPVIPEFIQLESTYEAADPLLKILQQQQVIAQQEIKVAKALRLPKIKFGYHYQGLLGQNYNGFHTGISIPLWEHKNTVDYKQAALLTSDLEMQAHVNEHYFHIKHIYEKYRNLSITLAEYQSVFESISNVALLSKALQLGEISAITYFSELNYFLMAYGNYLETEKEYHLVIAELYKYEL